MFGSYARNEANNGRGGSNPLYFTIQMFGTRLKSCINFYFMKFFYERLLFKGSFKRSSLGMLKKNQIFAKMETENKKERVIKNVLYIYDKMFR